MSDVHDYFPPLGLVMPACRRSRSIADKKKWAHAGCPGGAPVMVSQIEPIISLACLFGGEELDDL
jgi:hypothetical protein